MYMLSWHIHMYIHTYVYAKNQDRNVDKNNLIVVNRFGWGFCLFPRREAVVKDIIF